MKQILTIALILCGVGLHAQSYKMTPQGNTSETTLIVKNFFGDIVMEGISGAEIMIETSDYEGIPEKAKGLKPLSATGPENTGIGLSVVQEGNKITITSASKNADGEYVFKVPKNMKVMVDISSWQAGDLTVKGMASEVEAKSMNGALKFVNVTGPIIANSLSADIEVIFDGVNQTSPTHIVSTSGDIDITIPTTTKGNFKMSSVSGEVYTDLDFKFAEDKDLKRYGGGMSADAKLNGGGVEITLKCVSGDIYIRGK